MNFKQLRKYLDQAYRMSDKDHLNPGQVMKTLQDPNAPHHKDYMDLYQHLRQFTTRAPMIAKIQQYIAGKVVKKVS